MLRRLTKEGSLLVIAPDHLGAAAIVEAPALEAGIGVDEPVLEPERQGGAEHAPGIIGLALRLLGQLVAPGLEESTGAPIIEPAQGKVTEGVLDQLQLAAVVGLGALGQRAEGFLIVLVGPEHREQVRCPWLGSGLG